VCTASVMLHICVIQNGGSECLMQCTGRTWAPMSQQKHTHSGDLVSHYPPLKATHIVAILPSKRSQLQVISPPLRSPFATLKAPTSKSGTVSESSYNHRRTVHRKQNIPAIPALELQQQHRTTKETLFRLVSSTLSSGERGRAVMMRTRGWGWGEQNTTRRGE